MSNSDLENCSIRETQRWLNIAMEELGTDDRRIALSALLTGLHALRDRVGTDNAIHLGGQLPVLLRGAYYEGWQPGARMSGERQVDIFLKYAEATQPKHSQCGPESVARATFAALERCLDRSELRNVLRLLSEEMDELWPNPWERHSSLHLH